MSNCKKKVAFLINSLRGGGAERVISNLTRYMQQDYEISIILNDTEEIFYPYGGEIIDLHVKRAANILSYRYQLAAMVKRICVLRKYKKQKKFDVYVSFMDSANLANLLTGKKGAKLILSLRSDVNEHSHRKLYCGIVRPVQRCLYRRADYIVAVTEENRDKIRKIYNLDGVKVISISNGYDIDFIHDKMKEELPLQEAGIFHDSYVIVAMGRLSHEKGYEHLIHAFHILKKKHADVKLIILGEGKLRPGLEKKIAGLGLRDDIILLGAKKNPFSYLSHADLFVMASLYEGFPNALAEAMCCGLPCVVADFNGARELIMQETDKKRKKQITGISYEKYGVLVPGWDAEGNETMEEKETILAQAMAEFVEKPEMAERYRNASRERIKSLELREIVRRWEELFR